MKKHILALVGTLSILAILLGGVFYVVAGRTTLGITMQAIAGTIIYATIYAFIDFLEAQE